jgi:hypothetical protein
MHPNLVFYAVQRQTILLVKWTVLPLNGLIMKTVKTMKIMLLPQFLIIN